MTTEIEKADLLGETLVGGATETATIIIERLEGFDNRLAFRPGVSAAQFMIEVIVFYMHLVDRAAFTHFEAAKRQRFGDRFIVAVVKELLREVNEDVSAADFGKALRDTYSRRQIEYATYKTLIPPEGQATKGTLFWEFSKVLFGFFNDNNPATLMFLNLLVADFTKIMLSDVLKINEVLP